MRKSLRILFTLFLIIFVISGTNYFLIDEGESVFTKTTEQNHGREFDHQQNSESQRSGIEKEITQPAETFAGLKDQNQQNVSDIESLSPPTGEKRLQEGEVLQTDGHRHILQSEKIENMSYAQVTDFLETLRLSDNKNHISFETEYSIDQTVNSYLQNTSGLDNSAAVCAESLCAVLVSSEDFEHVNLALDKLSSNESLGKFVNGGMLHIYTDQGRYHGLILGVIGSEKALVISN